MNTSSQKPQLPHWSCFYLFPVMAIASRYFALNFEILWLPIFLGYGLFPYLDQTLKQDWDNPDI